MIICVEALARSNLYDYVLCFSRTHKSFPYFINPINPSLALITFMVHMYVATCVTYLNY